MLRDAQSPAAEWGNELWTVCQFEGIDPAVALAFFRHESTFGKAGICKDYDTKNWGNVRSPEDPAAGAIIPTRGGPFAKYSSWQLGLVDWCRRLKGPKYAGEGRMTVETIIPKYAPSSDNNNEQAYVNAVKADVAKWSQNVPATYTVRVTAQPRLRVRQGPSTRYAQAVLADKSLAWVNFDAHLECDGTKTEDQGPWHHLVGGLGYVSGEYVVKE